MRPLHRLAEQVDTWVEGAEAGESMESAFTGLPVPLPVCNPHSVAGHLSSPLRRSCTIAVASDAERGGASSSSRSPRGR